MSLSPSDFFRFWELAIERDASKREAAELKAHADVLVAGLAKARLELISARRQIAMDTIRFSEMQSHGIGLELALEAAACALEAIPVAMDSVYWKYRQAQVDAARAAKSPCP